MVDDDGVAVAAAKVLGQQHMAAGGHDHRILRLLRLDDDICRGAPAVAVVRAALAVGTAHVLGHAVEQRRVKAVQERLHKAARGPLDLAAVSRQQPADGIGDVVRADVGRRQLGLGAVILVGVGGRADRQRQRLGIAVGSHGQLGVPGLCVPRDGQVADPAVGGPDEACAFQRARQRRFGPAHGAADTHGGHAALLHRRCAERDGRLDADGEAELPGLGAGDAGAVLGGTVRRGDDEFGVKRAVLRKQIAAEAGDAALVHGLLVGVGDGQLGAVVGRRHDNIRRCVGYGILEHNGRGIERFGIGAPEKAADHRHMPLVGRGSKLLTVKGDLDFGQHVRRGAAVKPCYAAACDDEHEQHNEEQPLEHTEHTAPEGLRDRILRLVVLVVGGAVMLRCLGRRGRPGRRRGVLLQPGHDLRNRKLRRAGDVRHACGLSGKGFIVGKVIAENKAGRLGSVLRGDVPGLLGRVGDGCVCRGGLGGRFCRSRIVGGRGVRCRFGLRPGGLGPFRRLGRLRGTRDVGHGGCGSVLPGGGLRRFGLAFGFGLGKLRCGGNGALLWGGLALRGLVSRGFFRRLSSLRRLGLCGFCCLCVFFGPRLLGGRGRLFCGLPVCGGRLGAVRRRRGRIGGRLGAG